MASCELDPVFVKALKLLQSRSKDSYFHLKQMYDEVVAQRRADTAVKREGNGDTKPFGNGSFSSGGDTARKRELDNSNLEKLKQDIAELTHEVPAKKIKLEPGNSVSASSSPGADRERDQRAAGEKSKPSENPAKEKPRERLREIGEDIFFGPSASTSASNRAKERERQEREEREKQASKAKEKKEIAVIPTVVPIDSGSDTEVSDDGDYDDGGQGDRVDMQFDLDIGNLSCVICNSMSISSTNRLVECQECHSLYHQDCHKPPVTEDVNDPRFVWYCYKCTKNFKKIVVKNQKKTTKPGSSTSARDSPISKPVKIEPAQILQPFKRPEAVKSTVAKDTTEAGRGLIGLASLAKNLNSRSSASASSSASSLDQSSGNSRSSAFSKPAVTETKSSTSVSWTGSAAFSAARPASLGKSESSQKFGKTAPAAPSASKSAAVLASGSGTVVGGTAVKMSQSTLMSADKRLQNMKKKAKMAEKRPR